MLPFCGDRPQKYIIIIHCVKLYLITCDVSNIFIKQSSIINQFSKYMYPRFVTEYFFCF